MLTAQKSKPFRRLFYLYQKHYLIKRNFHTVVCKGDVDPIQSGPVIYIANHSSWWDGLLIFQLTEQLSNLDHYIMMDEKGLSKYQFFRKLGAFSVNKQHPRDIVRSLNYSEQLVQQGKAIWMFPQGAIEHQEKRPFELESGIGALIKTLDQVIVKPVSFHYSFSEQQKPIASIIVDEVLVRNGRELDRHQWTQVFRDILEKQVDAHRDYVIEHPHFYDYATFKPINKRSKSTSDLFDDWKEGIRKWMPFS
ncbi:lysophospholipid acyltransferase family protein [Radiobacillus sp. PE A8.2]|uniref:lysophospholipid acyltransferase family protein n=1 Tax=Radiobacillus sp. PE A8.2 TaxID=3380349 RepID=UPI0038907E72